MVSSTTSVLGQLQNSVFAGSGQKFASIDQGSATTTEVVAAVTGYRIRILAAVFTGVGSSITVALKSASTQLTGEIAGASALNVILPYNPAGWVQTEAGEAFQITSTNGAINGCIVYEEVAAA
jgi:hypothetical protein